MGLEKTQQPHVGRLLQVANDVESNPGPPKIVRNGLINGNKAKNGTEKQPPASNGNPPNATNVPENPTESFTLEEVKVVVEKQTETIRQQRSELEGLRKQMEKSMQIQQDFQSELSEIRKNWQVLNGDSNGKKPADETVFNKLEMLAAAYNDIQDRLYEIDKSWKNNLMIYGVAYSEAEEDDLVLTEEKVRVAFIPGFH